MLKVKSEFVTNSSSTSYVIFLPTNFNIGEFFHLLGKDWADYNEEEKEEIKLLMKVLVKSLIEGDVVGEDGDDAFWMARNIFIELDLVISSWSSGPDNGTIININSKDVKDRAEIIKKGGWGVKYGGWGKTSE